MEEEEEEEARFRSDHRITSTAFYGGECGLAGAILRRTAKEASRRRDFITPHARASPLAFLLAFPGGVQKPNLGRGGADSKKSKNYNSIESKNLSRTSAGKVLILKSKN